MRVTIKMIAELAGISKSTADRALKGRPGVKDAVREQVLRIAREVNYQPNSIGQALRMQRSSMRLAVVLYWGIFEKQMHGGVLSAAQEFRDYGVQLEFHDLKSRSVEELHGILTSLRHSGVSGVIVKPMRHPSIVQAVDALQEAGIPVVALTSDLPESRRFCFVGQDYWQSGRVAGDLMRTVLGTGGTVLIFQENREFEAYSRREEGIIALLSEKAPGITVRTSLFQNEGAPENYQLALEEITAHPELSGIICTGISYPTIAEAVRDAGRTDIIFIGYDIYDTTVALMEDGAVDFVLSQDPFREGYESVKILFHSKFSETKPTASLCIMPVGIHNRENIQYYL
ncbi:MAG: LacI family DNA-binding transcriptional regulator [Planctomycetaceae bacterium]|nr:LacI family DNA-binding transcriptional regulator [Planctomycetaceae bacterium]